MATQLFDTTIVGTAEQAVEFVGNIIDSSTEWSICLSNRNERRVIHRDKVRV
jgi:hypothetical protein